MLAVVFTNIQGPASVLTATHILHIPRSRWLGISGVGPGNLPVFKEPQGLQRPTVSPAPETSSGNTLPGEKVQTRGGWKPPAHLDRKTQAQTQSCHLPDRNKIPKCDCFCRNALHPPPLHDASDPEVFAAGPGPTGHLGFLLNEASPSILPLQLRPAWGPASPSNLIRMTAGSEQLLAFGLRPTDRLWLHDLQAQQFCPLSLGLRASRAPPEEEF